MKILAIETSCDETAAAVIGVENGQPIILSNTVSSQIDLHAKTGGIVPEVAARAHIEAMTPVIREALTGAKLEIEDITHLAVTAGPGLVGSLLVGFNTAKTLAYALEIPIIPINHIEGHVYSALALNQVKSPACQQARQKSKVKSGEPKFPILALTVSGGHTSLTLMKDHGVYENIGQTLDDAAGEAFDKVAKLLDLGYPGGPAISKIAEQHRSVIARRQTTKQSIEEKDCHALLAMTAEKELQFPRPMIGSGDFNFSFSGLKTAVLNYIRSNENYNKSEVAYAFEEAAVDVLCTKTMLAMRKFGPKAVILAGGVAANKRLREELSARLETANCQLLLPPLELCGDNAAMIGVVAYYHILKNDTKNWNDLTLDSNVKL